MKEQLTIDTAMRTYNEGVFATRKRAVKGQWSKVNCSTRGFTLMETLVAIAILLVSVVGPISLIGDALQKLYYARDEMIAINLAQEGVELVRWKRDSNLLAGVVWNTGIEPQVDGSRKDYVVNGAPAQVVPCAVALCEAEKEIYSNDNGYFQKAPPPVGSTKSRFTRIVSIEGGLSSADEIEITSVVTWNTGGQQGGITISESLFNLPTP